MHCVYGFPLIHQSNNPVRKRNAVNLEQCWPLGHASSFSKYLQTLYLIIYSGSLPGLIIKLDIYNFEKSALLSLMEEPEQMDLCPSSVLMSLPLYQLQVEWLCNH